MRFPQLPAIARSAVAASTLLILATSGPVAAQGAAQEAAECDMLCRLGGYLSTDHMAASPDDASVAAPARAHRAHAAAHKASAAKPITAKPAAAIAAAAPPRPAAARAAPSVPIRAATKVAEPARPHTAAAFPPGWVVGPAPAAPRHEAAAPVPSAPARAPQPAPAVARLRPTAPMRSTRTASLSSAIPGSAPAMQAGFH